MKTITIRLAGLLQSYGNEAPFNIRTTSNYPSKSAVIGMISAAFGYQRDCSKIQIFNRLEFAVRIDQPGKLLTDFQTVHTAKSSYTTHRDYLQDAVFVVAIGSDDEQLIDDIDEALHHPKYQLFLGRRANVPAGILKTKVFKNTNPLTALKQLSCQADEWYQYQHYQGRDSIQLKVLGDANLVPDAESFLVKDTVKSFDQSHRQHGFRAVVESNVITKIIWRDGNRMNDSGPDTHHNPMRFL
ncbi:type I-E CRISPR-associated protein Cas5/CasD [Lentilactobacillus raoultii]|uniref:Type I-E CRISPR-associated protein Cas5/CasD n=1 Tax=Lentilactobacillus raoultii TaxID=1987503 RepID=A0ABW3PIH2_9LACO|nr:type I-E CRISPR-associated protein Cas5/CasD [Lentilactobacillus raoultii]